MKNDEFLRGETAMKRVFKIKKTAIALAILTVTATNAVAVESKTAGGFYHNLFVNANGDLYAVGNNRYFQVTPSQNKVPIYSKAGTFLMYNDVFYKTVVHTGLVNVKSVAAAGNRSVALKKDGTAYFWGAVTSTNSAVKPDAYIVQQTPIKVPINNIIDIALGGTKMLLLVDNSGTKAGTVYEWNFDVNSAPVPVVGLPADSITSIAAAFDFRRVGEITTGVASTIEHFRVLTTNQEVYVWGANDKGQLGLGDYVNRPTPVKTGFAKAIGVGPSKGYNIAINGDVYQSGWFTTDGATTKGVNVPVKVANLFGAVKVAATQSGAFAEVDTGGVYAWGWHNYIGSGSYLRSVGASYVREAGTASDIGTSNQSFSVASLTGSYMSIGSDINGQLGDNSTIEKNSFPNNTVIPTGTIATTTFQLNPSYVLPWVDPEVATIQACLAVNANTTYVCEPGYVAPKPKPVVKCNNGWGNGDQCAPGNSEDHNNAENNQNLKNKKDK